MKFVSSPLASFLSDRQARKNIRALLQYVAFVTGVVLLYAVLFHVIMLHVEGRAYSWLTGVYWTLTVMSTLGLGDITFHTDIGRAFSIVVLLSGIVMLLIVLPFAFIRYFYAPWLEAQVRLRAPRAVRPDTRGHVIMCRYDAIAPGLIEKLKLSGIPYYVIEPDPTVAANMHGDEISVVLGDLESRSTYERLRVQQARLVLANDEDTVNSNIALTIREISPDVPIVATAVLEDSVNILTLSGSSHVLPLRQWLGEHLANRVNAGHTQVHVIGSYRNLRIAELPIHDTPMAGKRLRETGLRESVGINVVGVWERGRMQPARAGSLLTDSSVAVVVGSDEQLGKLDELVVGYAVNPNPVVVVGGGKVGRSATRALRRRGVTVHLIEKKPEICEKIQDLPNRLFQGDAADREMLMKAGLNDAPAVILTAHDDAMNIYLALYCRRLNPDLHIVSRITHERNLEAIHRAGADLALSYASLGVRTVFSIIEGRGLVVLGEGFDLFHVTLPEAFAGLTLAESGIGEKTGLNVIAIEAEGQLVTNPGARSTLTAGSELLMVGSPQQRKEFAGMLTRSAPGPVAAYRTLV